MCSFVSKVKEWLAVGDSVERLDMLLAELLPRSPELLNDTKTTKVNDSYL